MRGGDVAVKEHVWAVYPPLRDLDYVRLAAVRTRRFDPTLEVERGEDPERVPCAVGIPPAAVCQYSVCRRDRRERVRHADLVRRRVQHERVGLVQRTPAGTYVPLVTELASRGRATEFDERRVGAVAKVEKFSVDRLTLTNASRAAKELEQRRMPARVFPNAP